MTTPCFTGAERRRRSPSLAQWLVIVALSLLVLVGSFTTTLWLLETA